jgi:hypothetical protein
MPIVPTAPIQPPAQAQFVIVNVIVQVEPNVTVGVSYAPADGNGNPILNQAQYVQLNGAAMALLGTNKAKLYAALASQVPALAGVVS